MPHRSHHELPPPLAHLRGERPAAPSWFTDALAQRPERTRFVHEGADIDLLAWGPRGAPGLLLVHGNGAHAEWFSFIAPLLADRFRVAALSLSGMGHSARRPSYAVSQWADEALAAAEQAGLFEADVPPLFAGHSFGGFPMMTAAARHGQRLRGVVIMDTPLRPPEGQAEREKRRAEAGFRPAKVYPSIDAALARFRFLPPQGCEHLYIADHIARSSLAPAVDERGNPGYAWLTDPYLFRGFRFGRPHVDLGQARCPVTLVRGARSRLITEELFALAVSLAAPGSATLQLADADHHLMVDQPLAFAQMLAGLMSAPPAMPSAGG